jgi:hypothetical protein
LGIHITRIIAAEVDAGNPTFIHGAMPDRAQSLARVMEKNSPPRPLTCPHQHEPEQILASSGVAPPHALADVDHCADVGRELVVNPYFSLSVAPKLGDRHTGNLRRPIFLDLIWLLDSRGGFLDALVAGQRIYGY